MVTWKLDFPGACVLATYMKDTTTRSGRIYQDTCRMNQRVSSHMHIEVPVAWLISSMSE